MNYIAAVAIPLNSDNSTWFPLGIYPSKSQAQQAINAYVAANPYDTYTIVQETPATDDSFYNKLMAILNGKPSKAPYFLTKNTSFPDVGEPETHYTAFILPHDCLTPDVRWTDKAWLMFASFTYREEAIEAAETFCNRNGWQGCKVDAKKPIYPQINP